MTEIKTSMLLTTSAVIIYSAMTPVRFTDVAAAAGVEDISSGMSVAWSDANRDGRMDVYVSNMFSSAGGRVAFQRQFGKGNPGATADFQRMARGNTLFLGSDRGNLMMRACLPGSMLASGHGVLSSRISTTMAGRTWSSQMVT